MQGEPGSLAGSIFRQGREVIGVMDKADVKCYSGGDYAERPLSFTWQGVVYRVEEVEQSWREPGKICFRVRTEAGNIFKLCYNSTHRVWDITELALR